MMRPIADAPERRGLAVAGVAASIATAGDLLLLYVANAQRPELGLPEAGRAWLWLGGTLGVFAIPVYAVGYRSASRLVAVASVRGARAVFVAGALAALLGSAIHGLTAAQIAAQLDAPAPGLDPVTATLSGGPVLLVLWGVAALAVAVASASFFWSVARGATSAPRSAALANPALVTLALAAAALPSTLLRSFLAPAAPNLAHLVFFVVCSRVPAGGRSPDGGSIA